MALAPPTAERPAILVGHLAAMVATLEELASVEVSPDTSRRVCDLLLAAAAAADEAIDELAVQSLA